MKIRLVGKNLDDIAGLLDRFGMTDAGADIPELVIAHGGDGAMLGAEREYPDIPKLAIRDSATAPTCSEHTAEKVLRRFAEGKLTLSKVPKLRAAAAGRVLTGINDLVIHSLEHTSALRYRIMIDGVPYAHEIVGDGLCFSGVHGSTAYYRSITRGVFRVGVGVAFLNTTEVVDHLVLCEKSIVTVEIVRGRGLLMADNDPDQITVDVGEKVTLQQTDETAEIWGLEGFMCPKCRFFRHQLPAFAEK